MKRKITLLLSVAVCVLKMNSQVVFTENFTSPFTPTMSGWVVTNNSAPASTNTPWFQGNPGAFSAFNGAPADYYANNYQQIAPNSAGTISSWLISPTFTNLTNGGMFTFATRIPQGTATPFPDRLQVLVSTAGTLSSVGTGTGTVGTFTTNLLDINPNLTTNTVGAVNNGSVNGYPDQWTVYTVTLSGISGTVSGRFAFRYFVTNGGETGSNSDYIGIDAVQYALPCAQPTININPPSANICSGQTVNVGASGAVNYTWSNGALTNTAVLVPSVTTVYTVVGTSSLGCMGSKTIAVTVTTTPTVAVNNMTTCPGTSIVLNASGATNYTWSTGALTPTVSVPGSNATYTVTGFNGTCLNTKTVSVVTGASLSIIVSSTPSTAVCSGASLTLTAMGATSYSWAPGGQTNSVIVVSPTGNTTYSVGGLTGFCTGLSSIVVTVNPVPSLSVSSSASLACINTTVTLTGSGANTYTWIAGGTATANPVSLITGTQAGVITITLTGTSAAGCVGSTVFSQSVSLCTGIENNTPANNAASVFPNPFTNELKVTGLTGNVEIYNTLGQVVISTTVTESETINTTNLPKGVYIVKTYSAEGNVSKSIRIIKN